MEKLNGLDLFSGIGGNSLALKEWVRTIAYCEFDRYAQSVLLSKMRQGNINSAPIWDDIRTLTKNQIIERIDIIVGGFPCQDISMAGRGEGVNGKKSGLFYEIIRLTKEFKPTFVFLENVPAIRTRGLDKVLQEFTKAGYDCKWTMLSASSLGANHERERWFLLAYTNSTQCQGSRISSRRYEKNTNISLDGWWKIEPKMDRMANGIPRQMDQLRCLGNAVVPKQAKEAFKMLMGLI